MTARASTACALIFNSVGSVSLLGISVHDGARVSDLKDVIGVALDSRGRCGFDVYLAPRNDPGWIIGVHGSLVPRPKTLERFATLDAMAVGEDLVRERIDVDLVNMVQLLIVRREPHNPSHGDDTERTDGPGGWRSWLPFLAPSTGGDLDPST